MIIKDLMSCGRETKHRIRELEASDGSDLVELEFLKRKLEVLNELQKFVTSGDWTRKASREKYIALVRSKFDYKLIAERFNTTRESLDVFAVRQDKRLRAAIGKALCLIEQNRIEEGLDCFYAAAGEFSDRELEYRVSDLLPKTLKKDSFLMSECLEEVEILRSLLRTNVCKRLNGADSGKLGYLVFLLQSEDNTFREQRMELIRKLRKKDS